MSQRPGQYRYTGDHHAASTSKSASGGKSGDAAQALSVHAAPPTPTDEPFSSNGHQPLARHTQGSPGRTDGGAETFSPDSAAAGQPNLVKIRLPCTDLSQIPGLSHKSTSQSDPAQQIRENSSSRAAKRKSLRDAIQQLEISRAIVKRR
eukprot:COSAG01_NODE_36003_length_523_cov_15.125000_1_plen_148_part_10